MELRFTKRNQTLIAHISGEIDHHTSGELRLKIDRALEQISGKNIIFCFREVTFMDSSGIGMMIGRYRYRAWAGVLPLPAHPRRSRISLPFPVWGGCCRIMMS